MAVYGYMELLPLSVLWNLALIYLAQILFQGKKVRKNNYNKKISDYRKLWSVLIRYYLHYSIICVGLSDSFPWDGITVGKQGDSPDLCAFSTDLYAE